MTEAGPGGWRSDKEPCPTNITVVERNELLQTAVALDPANPRSRRFNARRGGSGLELYEAKYHTDVEGEPEFHGHPTNRIPPRVARRLRDSGRITAPEFARLVKLGWP